MTRNALMPSMLKKRSPQLASKRTRVSSALLTLSLLVA